MVDYISPYRKGVPDLILFLTVFSLVGTGIAMSYSASAIVATKVYGDSFFILKKQLLWFVVSFAALLIMQEIDYRVYARYTKFLLLISFVMLLLTLIPGLGHVAKGSSRWIRIGFFGVQPAEFVKIFMVIYLSKVFSSESASSSTSHSPLMQLLIPLVILGVMFFLILMQPDFGTAIDLLLVGVAILFVSGFSLMYILFLGAVSIPAFYLLVYKVEYRRDRIIAFFNPWSDRFGVGYHIIQSFIAFKKGGLIGRGLGNGTQKIMRLPEPHTDFIFAVIAEETGLFGTFMVIGLFLLLFWRGMHIALLAVDDYGRLLAIGLTLMIVLQAFINIGVVSGALPTTGIPLPFISYGGSSLLSNMMCCGILLNISRYREGLYDNIQYEDNSDGVTV